MNREAFESLVADVLDSLPEEFASKLDNVVVLVEDWPTEEHYKAGQVSPGMTLYGLYQGIPRTKRGNYTAVLPDRITIFAGPILAAAGWSDEVVKNQVRSTVLHEIGHYFGMNEEEIRKAQNRTDAS